MHGGAAVEKWDWSLRKERGAPQAGVQAGHMQNSHHGAEQLLPRIAVIPLPCPASPSALGQLAVCPPVSAACPPLLPLLSTPVWGACSLGVGSEMEVETGMAPCLQH